MRHLNFPGDRVSTVGQVLGPDMFGGCWRIVSAEFDPATGKTRTGLLPALSLLYVTGGQSS